jgi:hypothetical protein
MISNASACQNGLTGPATVLSQVIAAVEAGVTEQFWYCFSASVAPPAEMIGGLMTRCVESVTEITRKVLSVPVSALVM